MANKIGFLPNVQKTESTKRFQDAAARHGASVTVLTEFEGELMEGETTPHTVRTDLAGNCDVVYLRQGLHCLTYAREIEDLGVKVVPSSRAIELTGDKVKMLKALRDNAIPIPKTAFDDECPSDWETVVRKAQQNKYVVKDATTAKGETVELKEVQTLPPKFAYLPKYFGKPIVQEKLEIVEDFRAHIIGNAVFTYKRERMADAWKSNYQYLDDQYPVMTPPEIGEICKTLREKFGLEYCGVDIGKTADGKYVVFELNSMAAIPKYGLADYLVDYLMNIKVQPRPEQEYVEPEGQEQE